MGLSDLTVPEYKKDKDWYLRVVNRYTAFHNTPMFFGMKSSNDGMIFPTMSDQMAKNLAYYFGEQPIGRNYSVAQGNALRFLQTQNNQIFTLVNSLHGKIQEFMSKFNISTEILSQNARNKKDELRNQLMFMVDNKDYFEMMEQLGIFYNPMPDNIAIETREDVDEFMETDYREFGALVAEWIGKAMIVLSDYANLKPQMFLDLIIYGVCADDREIVNGIIKENKILAQGLILDLRDPNDNNFNDSAWFRGYFNSSATPYEILEEDGEYLSEGAIEQIKACAASTSEGYGVAFLANNTINPTTFFSYYSLGPGPGRPVIGMSKVRMYFRARHDYRLKEKKGNIVNIKDFNEKGEVLERNANTPGMYQNWRWYYADVIAGQWVARHGLVSNAVYDPFRKGRQECPMKVYIDNYVGGFFKSRVSRMINLQDDINLADLKIKQAELNDLGVNYIIKGAGDSSETKGALSKIFADFSSMHMTMLKANLDDDFEDFMRQKFAEVVDFTGSLKVVDVYQAIKATCKNEMEVMMHLPDVAQGLQQSTIGKGVQSATVDLANTGLAPLFNGFINFVQRGLQYSSNMQKISWSAKNADVDQAKMYIGDRGYNWLMSCKEENFETLGIYINPYDQIDNTNRQKLDMKVQALIQNYNLLISPDAFLKLDTMTSFREALIFIRRQVKLAVAKADKIAAEQRQDALAMKDAEIQAGVAGKAAVVDGQKYSADQRKAGLVESANIGAKTKEQIADLQAQVKLLIEQGKEKATA